MVLFGGEKFFFTIIVAAVTQYPPVSKRRTKKLPLKTSLCLPQLADARKNLRNVKTSPQTSAKLQTTVKFAFSLSY